MTMASATADEKKTLSIAILGGGISGLSCASQLLSQHKESHDPASKSSYELEVTLFDTGRLRPGGRCSSRLPGDKPVKNKQSPSPTNNSNGNRNNRRACDTRDAAGASGSNDDPAQQTVPENIQRALNGAAFTDNSSTDRIVTSMGPVDHAAQILSIPTIQNESFDEFQSQLQQWQKEGVVESFPEGSVCELLSTENGKSDGATSTALQTLKGDMYYGKGGMGSIPLAIREHCLSFNGFGDNYSGQSFRIAQDVWVSPSSGVKYIGDREEPNADLSLGKQWELRAGKKSLGKYNHLVISHNGKCADRIMSRTPAKAFHSLLRTKFAPYVPQHGGKEMTLNSIYSLVFAVKSEKKGSGASGLSSPIANALSKLASSTKSKEEDVYTVMIKNEPSLRLLSCNTLKHHHDQNSNSDSNIEVYTLLSSPKFGKQFKGPQENLPADLTQKVTLLMLRNLEQSLNLKEGSVVSSVVDLTLQLWGAAVPMNTWQSSSSTTSGRDGCVYDAKYGVGACGDWILDPSIAGAWESGRRLANCMLDSQEGESPMSVGLPDRTPSKDSGKFVPSRVALESGIGTIPSSPNSSNRPERGPSNPASSGSSNNNNGSRNNNGRRRNNNKKGGRGRSQPQSR